VLKVAGAYVEAGSHVILTNTFGANRHRLADTAAATRVVEINRSGARLSKTAADGRALVFASMGPSGKLLVGGDVTTDELMDAFLEQAEALAEGGVDALVIETMSDPREAECAIAAGRRTGLPIIASLVFDSGRGKDRTMMGTTPEVAAARLTTAGADVVGANCGQGIAGFVTLCQRLRAATGLPLWIKPNAGLPELDQGRVTYRTTPAEFAAHAPALVAAGAGFLGGCCGTTPEFIRTLAGKLGALTPAPPGAPATPRSQGKGQA
jgi:methionine synthase I (cobalamin-dependent)